jgi:hypothetical protein
MDKNKCPFSKFFPRLYSDILENIFIVKVFNIKNFKKRALQKIETPFYNQKSTIFYIV